MWKDQQFQLAILVAPIYWLGLWVATRPEIHLLWPLEKPWVFLSIALLYPVMEEVIFRGLVQDGLHKYMKWKISGPISTATWSPVVCSWPCILLTNRHWLRQVFWFLH